MQGGSTFLVMLLVMVGMMFFMSRSQKKQYQKRMESLNKLQKGYEVITIGGLYGTVDEVDTERKTVVLDAIKRSLFSFLDIYPLEKGLDCHFKRIYDIMKR